MKKLLVGLAAWLTAAAIALAGSGTGTITAVTDNLDSTYDVTLSSVTGISTGDHLFARISTGAGGLYTITSINTSTLVVVATDNLTEEKGSAFGVPVTGTFGYSTPTVGIGYSLIPYAAPGWDAAHRRNFFLSARQPLLTYAEGEALSSSTSAYAVARTYVMPPNLLNRDGAALRIKANTRQAAGSGVYMRLSLGTNNGTALTVVGKNEFLLVRSASTTADAYSSVVGATSAYAKNAFTGLDYTTYQSLTLEIQGGDTAAGTANDFWTVELLR